MTLLSFKSLIESGLVVEQLQLSGIAVIIVIDDTTKTSNIQNNKDLLNRNQSECYIASIKQVHFILKKYSHSCNVYLNFHSFSARIVSIGFKPLKSKRNAFFNLSQKLITKDSNENTVIKAPPNLFTNFKHLLTK
ncbi:hypothetical protein Gasu2_21920 [Galdieria sulphuraria]|uniref:Uncharacterized protein n=1 Tax=Galdieria sulphuraria TaxID=130081 RepID=M2WVE0_GALSU|nr:uncharacterized protein Gasu_46040 [Galdieria sulphuraria]EME27945.1 hypothetical protein Gasu_46040 [Galdieria sulphuraria]GJD07863.1 hypothetical protein Gasu2_21920 [Galdieria sulphuraria]|eukprot:XP_005704465.1 hypothetical protein Gasu_46040 [Galdieria sulphuraria]